MKTSKYQLRKIEDFFSAGLAAQKALFQGSGNDCRTMSGAPCVVRPARPMSYLDFEK
jgi:hypothetical protein